MPFDKILVAIDGSGNSLIAYVDAHGSGHNVKVVRQTG